MKYRIKELRKARKWTLEQLAEVVGTSKGYLSDLERGNRDGGVQMLRDIAHALGVSEGEIFEAEDPADAEVLKHMQDFMKLSAEDRRSVQRHVLGLLSDDS